MPEFSEKPATTPSSSQKSGEKGGFEIPQPARSAYQAELFKRNQLPEAPSMEQIEPVAVKLLENIETLLEGIELILGRKLDYNKNDIDGKLLMGLAIEPDVKKKFGILLLAKTVEELKKKK